MVRKSLLLASLLLMSACSFVGPEYSVDADNVVHMRKFEPGIAVGEFSEKSSFNSMCRAAGPVAPPNGMSLPEYIKDAFEDELKIADVYDKISPRVTLTGRVDEASFSSVSGEWDLALTLFSSNGRDIYVENTYEFDTSFVADGACRESAAALMPAVRHLIRAAITHPKFETLIK